MLQFVALCLILTLVVKAVMIHHEQPHTHVEQIIYAPPPTPPVTVALTGVSSTGDVGNLRPSITVAL